MWTSCNLGLTHHSTQRNEQESLLLSKLPPEIRNRIYYFTLGGRTLHVHNIHWREIRAHHCKASVVDDEIYDDYKSKGTTPDFYQHHRDCNSRTNAIGLSLTLLQDAVASSAKFLA